MPNVVAKTIIRWRASVMNGSPDYIDNRQPLSEATQLARSLVDSLLTQPGSKHHKLLSGTRIFYHDLSQPDYAIDSQQLLSLLKNIRKQHSTS